MREVLLAKYGSLLEAYDIEESELQNLNEIIKESLNEFIKSNSRVAIYCNGKHTKMLMSDFMFELRTIKYIIDNSFEEKDSAGFYVIKDEDIEKEQIDGVIISSYIYRDEIVERLKRDHPHVHYLDLYEEFAKHNVYLFNAYYAYGSAYNSYKKINLIQRKIKLLTDVKKIEEEYKRLVTAYIHIKDFYNAISAAQALYEYVEKSIYRDLIEDLKDIYETEKKAAACISQRAVLLFCFDGLRRCDVTEKTMPNLALFLQNKGYCFHNAYSYSTSTYESLIPVYSENTDQRTQYYLKNVVEQGKCRFINEAVRQGRQIKFYTDSFHYIEDDHIDYVGNCPTVTEKIWQFILDAVEEKNGLYYIHELYESHYSFPNPYTENEIVADGMAMLFDYMPKNGGALRTDYEKQHEDALRYLDDVVAPFLERVNCSMVLYADHGNLILRNGKQLEDVTDMQLTCGEEWIQIPYAVYSQEMGVGVSDQLISLLSFNDVVIDLLNARPYTAQEREYIKCGRSALYNPDFQYLYKKIGKEKCLEAFEVFLFKEGYKVIVYSDGGAELYLLPSEKKVDNVELKRKLIESVKEQVTVCAL